jgi:hypothetical protein
MWLVDPWTLRARAASLNRLATTEGNLAEAGICHVVAARCREIAAEIERLERRLATLECHSHD